MFTPLEIGIIKLVCKEQILILREAKRETDHALKLGEFIAEEIPTAKEIQEYLTEKIGRFAKAYKNPPKLLEIFMVNPGQFIHAVVNSQIPNKNGLKLLLNKLLIYQPFARASFLN